MKSFPAFGILFGARNRLGELRSLLEKNSGLPGPRGNLELAAAFAQAVSRMRLQDWQWDFLLATSATPAARAPENTPGVYLVFCALLALGAQYGAGLPRHRRRVVLATVRAAAGDTRWRIREAAAMALQQIGERDAEGLKDIVEAWMPRASLLELRAIAAGLAHPPILDHELARFALDVARRILGAISRLEEGARRTEPFKVLRKGMAYALSVFVAASPSEGFTLMRRSAAVRDRDLAWIIRENLRKKRLSAPYPTEVRQVAGILDEAKS